VLGIELVESRTPCRATPST